MGGISDVEQRKIVVQKHLETYCKHLDPQQLNTICNTSLSHNPMYLVRIYYDTRQFYMFRCGGILLDFRKFPLSYVFIYKYPVSTSVIYSRYTFLTVSLILFKLRYFHDTPHFKKQVWLFYVLLQVAVANELRVFGIYEKVDAQIESIVEVR